jgi:beta-galactosidase
VILFDGIYNHSTIWLNGKKIGGRINGYTPFYYDITEQLAKAGSENVLAVRVDRSRYIDSRWYPGAGIYRNVTMVAVDPLHIPIWGVYVQTPVATKERAEVALAIEVNNKRAVPAEFVIETKGTSD